MDRRRLIAAGLALAATPARAALKAATIKVGEREVELTIVPPQAPARGVILFSHGAGDWPSTYTTLLEIWAKAGFLVAAPLHVDSNAHPRTSDYTMRAAFPLRIEDLKAAGAWAAKTAPGLPIAAAGHSYGSLVALVLGGALGHAPTVKAVVGWSSLGLVPGLIDAQSYQTLAVPTLMITGDQDIRPDATDSWRAHLRPFEASPAGEKYAWIGKGVDHRFGGAFITGKGDQAAALADAARLSVTFLRAEALGDADARDALAAQRSSPGAVFRRR